MGARDFSCADIPIADIYLNTHQSVRNISYNHGLRELLLGTKIEFIKGILDKSMLDFLIYLSGFPNGFFVECVRLVRQGKEGQNPFVHLITLVEEPTPELVG